MRGGVVGALIFMGREEEEKKNGKRTVVVDLNYDDFDLKKSIKGSADPLSSRLWFGKSGRMEMRQEQLAGRVITT